ncbi:MAG TPA: FAD-dependent oxidoreductase [Beutenbergiaceae bacterium]|nr:FAD-dependent oxidoreductase [Beutenbergiaceae bacterium]
MSTENTSTQTAGTQTTGSQEVRTDVLIIGAGPAGLTAARTLAERTSYQVTVVEREPRAGGIPRHSDHTGYGIRDKHTITTGPKYARRLVAEAEDAGAAITTQAMVTDWAGANSLWLTSPGGRTRLETSATLLTTGARERPRPARMIPGGRPAGVYTTGELQNAVHLHHQPVGTRAVILGAELVSWSAVLTLKEAGCRTETLITAHRSPESYALFNLGGRIALRTPVATRHRVTKILGRQRVSGVEVEDQRTGRRRVIECDTVITTGDWIPDHELARSAGIALDPGTAGPLVDAVARTDRQGVFAAGNLVHPVDTADVAALGGQHAARAVQRYLEYGLPEGPRVPIGVAAPFRWATPGVYQPGLPAPARGRLQTWVHDVVRIPRIAVRQDGRVLTRRTIPWPASPGRVFRLPWDLLDGVDGRGGPVELSLS